MASIKELEKLEEASLEKGAYRAKAVPANQVVVDERVRMKCEIPLCPHFGHCLTCPPNIMSVDEFRKALSKYDSALMVQTKSSITGEMGEADKKEVLKFMANPVGYKSKDSDGKEAIKDLDSMKLSAIRLHQLINEVEGVAMAMGYHYATGLIGGECMLCSECVGPASGEKCRLPYQARPSMEGVGIDVLKTSVNAGLEFQIPPTTEIIWSGLILVD
jgi:predicted metal-binding protein